MSTISTQFPSSSTAANQRPRRTYRRRYVIRKLPNAYAVVCLTVGPFGYRNDRTITVRTTLRRAQADVDMLSRGGEA